MKLILCADELWGMAFNHRRQSRDSRQLEHMLALTAEGLLWVSPYSLKLFAGTRQEPRPFPANLRADPDYLSLAGPGEYAFAEIDDINGLADRAERLYIYYWNRQYASDLRISRDFMAGFAPVRSQSFAGTAHDRILLTEYRPVRGNGGGETELL